MFYFQYSVYIRNRALQIDIYLLNCEFTDTDVDLAYRNQSLPRFSLSLYYSRYSTQNTQ